MNAELRAAQQPKPPMPTPEPDKGPVGSNPVPPQPDKPALDARRR